MNNDFIGVYDNFLTKEECEGFIQLFEYTKRLNLTYTRKQNEKSPGYMKSDETLFLIEHLSLSANNPKFITMMDKFWKKYGEYISEYDILELGKSHDIEGIRIQKTLPSQGYHVWHHERMSEHSLKRSIAWMIYLNDVEEGGETEFLYYSKRMKPKQGTILFWPAGFTHTHRGNPPLTDVKYTITSWININY